MLASIDLRRCLVLLGLLLLCGACEHAEGGACQNNRDCEDGLVCDLGDEDRGVCRMPEDIDAGTDAGGAPDADGPLEPDADAAVDAAADAAPDPEDDAGEGADGG